MLFSYKDCKLCELWDKFKWQRSLIPLILIPKIISPNFKDLVKEILILLWLAGYIYLRGFDFILLFKQKNLNQLSEHCLINIPKNVRYTMPSDKVSLTSSLDYPKIFSLSPVLSIHYPLCSQSKHSETHPTVY